MHLGACPPAPAHTPWGMVNLRFKSYHAMKGHSTHDTQLSARSRKGKSLIRCDIPIGSARPIKPPLSGPTHDYEVAG